MDKLKFFFNNKATDWIMSGMSIAACWIWAPALFVSASIAYTNGFIGFLWFLIPNVLCLALFAFFIQWVRNNYDQEHTLGTLVKDKLKSPFVHNLYIIEMIMLAIGAFSIQLVGGGAIIAKITGLSYPLITIIVSVFVLSYTIIWGIKASIIADLIQYTLIFSGVACGLYYLFQYDFVFNSQIFFHGIKNVSFWETTFAFGVPTAIGLISGTFGDQMFWQRGYSAKKETVLKSFLLGAFLFALVPIGMSCFGFYAPGMSLKNPNANIINFEIIKLFPVAAIVMFALAIFSGLSSAMDSHLCASSSVGGYDLNKSIGNSKVIMLLVALLGVLIANIPGIQIVHIFLFNGSVRSVVLMSTLYTFFFKNPKYIIARNSILYNLIINVPMYVIGTIFKNKLLIFLASVSNIIIPIVIYLYLNNKIQEVTNE